MNLVKDIEARVNEKLAAIKWKGFSVPKGGPSGAVNKVPLFNPRGNWVPRQADPLSNKMENLRFKLEQILGHPISSVDDFSAALTEQGLTSPRAPRYSDVLKSIGEF